MKVNYKILTLLLISIVVVISSCRKDEELEKTSKDFLTAGNWQITALKIEPGIEYMGIVLTDIYSFAIKDCSKDDLITFNSDGTITEDEGPTKCNPEDPQTVTENTWTLSEDGKSISATFFGMDSGSADVLVLNETTFKFSTISLPEFASMFGITDQTLTVTMTLQ